jgi:hypothetical protein
LLDSDGSGMIGSTDGNGDGIRITAGQASRL